MTTSTSAGCVLYCIILVSTSVQGFRCSLKRTNHSALCARNKLIQGFLKNVLLNSLPTALSVQVFKN
uniref:Secreted protein n=1 Tax=Anguilla anguilla TaxID=7936 RepID=A0A0E9RFJ1_ANGAN